MSKRLKKWIGIITVIIAIITVIRLAFIIAKSGIIVILLGILNLKAGGGNLVSISKNDTKFLSLRNEESLEEFKNYLLKNGYTYLGQFGNSNLYEYEGIEIVVKRSNVLGRYYLFEIYNERYFESKIL